MFRQTIRDARATLGMNQQQLADAADVNIMTVSEIESGKRDLRMVRLGTFCDLCRALSLLPSQHIDSICAGTDTPQP